MFDQMDNRRSPHNHLVKEMVVVVAVMVVEVVVMVVAVVTAA